MPPETLTTHSVLFSLLLPFILLGIDSARHKFSRLLLWSFSVLTIIGIFLADSYRIIATNLTIPKEWDFLCSWIHAQVAVRRLNFYEPRFTQQILLPLIPSEEFRQEILFTGFHHPPPTMFLFYPLGLFDYQTSYALWYAMNILALLAALCLIYRQWFQGHRLIGLLASVCLFCSFRSALSTLSFGQTNFLILLLLVLFYKHRAQALSGAFLAVGCFVKPLVLILFLAPILERKWKCLLCGGITIVFAFLLSGLNFGWDTVTTYLTFDLLNRLPSYMYVQGINQSLLATVLRLVDWKGGTWPIAHPVFFLCALIITAVSCYTILRNNYLPRDLSAPLVWTLALLLYPATLEHYSVTLLFPFAALWAYRKYFPFDTLGFALFVSVSLLLVAHASGKFVFLAHALTWAVIIGLPLFIRHNQPKY